MYQRVLKGKFELMISDHSPVYDAMPERPPEARPTKAVESLGLRPKENVRIIQPKCTKQHIANTTPHKLCLTTKMEYSPLRLPKRTQGLINRKAYCYTWSNTLYIQSIQSTIQVNKMGKEYTKHPKHNSSQKDG
jgi:hypothetical protein